MAAATLYYVDPNAGTDDTTGNRGSVVGNPWKSVQFALDNITRDATDGDQLNLKAGTADTLSAKLDTSTYGTATAEAPLILRGYTTSANDGGVGDLNGGGSVAIFDDSLIDYVHPVDLHCHNCGSQVVWRGRVDTLVRCEFDTTTNLTCVEVSSLSSVYGCYVHDFTGKGITGANRGEVAYNFVEKSHASNTAPGIDPGVDCSIHHNIVVLSASGNAAEGIRLGAVAKKCFNNSIYSNAGTGSGIVQNGDTFNIPIYNNIVAGFSGSGGVGISTNGSRIIGVHSNAVHDCATAYNFGHDETFPYEDNETLSSIPFKDAASNDFTPLDTGNVLAGFLKTFLGPAGVVNSFPVKGAVIPEPVAAGVSGKYRGLILGGGLGAS